MRQGILVSSALGMSLMMSPENLLILGRGVGLSGSWFLAGILAACVVQRTTILSLANPLIDRPTDIPWGDLTSGAVGSSFGLAIFLCSRGILTAALSTAVLATAGFTFNEVFLYWFPNFLFAGLLLLGLVVLNLISESFSQRLQVAVVILALTGLVVLSVTGSLAAVPSAESPRNMGLAVPWSGLSRAFMILVGFELALCGLRPARNVAASAGRAMFLSLLVPALVLGLWASVSFRIVPGARLAESTIPHMIVARAIAGDVGRMLMGTVVLCGTVSVVNGLLLALPRQAAAIASSVFPRLHARLGGRLKPAVVSLAGLSVAAMLWVGMAGEPVLDVLVRGGLLFWLFNYVLILASRFCESLRPRDGAPEGLHRRFPWGVSGAMAILVFVLIILLIEDPNRGALVRFMLTAAGVAWAGSWTGLGIVRRGT